MVFKKFSLFISIIFYCIIPAFNCYGSEKSLEIEMNDQDQKKQTKKLCEIEKIPNLVFVNIIDHLSPKNMFIFQHTSKVIKEKVEKYSNLVFDSLIQNKRHEMPKKWCSYLMYSPKYKAKFEKEFKTELYKQGFKDPTIQEIIYQDIMVPYAPFNVWATSRETSPNEGLIESPLTLFKKRSYCVFDQVKVGFLKKTDKPYHIIVLYSRLSKEKEGLETIFDHNSFHTIVLDLDDNSKTIIGASSGPFCPGAKKIHLTNSAKKIELVKRNFFLHTSLKEISINFPALKNIEHTFFHGSRKLEKLEIYAPGLKEIESIPFHDNKNISDYKLCFPTLEDPGGSLLNLSGTKIKKAYGRIPLQENIPFGFYFACGSPSIILKLPNVKEIESAVLRHTDGIAVIKIEAPKLKKIGRSFMRFKYADLSSKLKESHFNFPSLETVGENFMQGHKNAKVFLTVPKGFNKSQIKCLDQKNITYTYVD